MDKNEQEYEIDLAKLGGILWQKKKQVLALCVAGAAIGFAYPLTQPPSYSSTIEMRVNTDERVANLSDTINLAEDKPINIMSIVELLQSPGMAEKALRNMDSVDPQERERLLSALQIDSKTALKTILKIENIRGTDLVKITAAGRTPEQAQELAQKLTDTFIQFHSSNKQAIQSRKADFLDKQVADAKKALMDAEEKAAASPNNESSQSYRQLQRDVKIKEDIYANLVKEQESSKIREQMNSEEIQVVSPANLPTTESGPRSKKKLYAVAGFAIGALLSLGYGLLCYRKENKREEDKA